MPNKLSLLCQYYAIGDIDFASYRQQRAIIINNILNETGDLTRPSVERSEDTTMREPQPVTQAALDPIPKPVNASHQLPLTANRAPLSTADKRSSFGLLKIAIWLLCLAFFAAAVLLTYDYLNQAPSTVPVNAMQTKSLTPSALKIEFYILIDQKSWWSESQITSFINTWDKASVNELQNLRLDSRYSQLMSDILAYEALPEEFDTETLEAIDNLKNRVQNNY